eukprot:g23638.t1
MFILGLLKCHNDTTRKLEEQHLRFCLSSLQPDDLNMEFTNLRISLPSAYPIGNILTSSTLLSPIRDYLKKGLGPKPQPSCSSDAAWPA